MDHTINETTIKYRDVFKSVFSDGVVVWRPITKQEHYDVKLLAENNLMTPLEQEEYVWDHCVVYTNYTSDTLKAGIVTTTVSQIFYFTGFSSPDYTPTLNHLAEARSNSTTDPFEQAIVLICKAFPSYKPDELESKTLKELCRLIALAEAITGIIYFYGDPEEVAEQKAMLERARQGKPTIIEDNYRGPVKGKGGVDSTAYDNAMLLNNPSSTGMKTEKGDFIPRVTKEDLYPKQKFVNTSEENRRMIEDQFPFTEEFKYRLEDS